MIPKIIHYVWVGNNPKPPFVLDCIATWKKYLPDYEIMEWGNECLDSINNIYVKEAYQNKKWAFVSDYLRLYALYKHGGVYLDTDVEVTQSFDQFLNLDFFSGYESYDGRYFPITAAMGSSKESNIITGLLAGYDNLHFEVNGKLDLEPNTFKISRFFTNEFNLSPPYDGSKKSHLTQSAIIYPSYYFCLPEHEQINFSIHHFSGSWLPSHSRKNKLNLFNKIIIARLKKQQDKGDLPLSHDEKILLTINFSKKISYSIILKTKVKNS